MDEAGSGERHNTKAFWACAERPRSARCADWITHTKLSSYFPSTVPYFQKPNSGEILKALVSVFQSKQIQF